MVGVLATQGSAPRGAGTRMLVTATGQHGTIGGGRLELLASDQARAILARPAGSWRIQDYPLGPMLGQCCGGRVRLMVEHVDAGDAGWLDRAASGRMLISRFDHDRVARSVTDEAAPVRLAAQGERPAIGTVLVERIGEHRRPLYLFGAGHVGKAIAAAVAALPFTLAWFDTREDQAALAGAVHAPVDDLAACIGDVPAGAAVLVLTHDHALDYALVLAALQSRASFVGLIGSATKRARFIARLAREGVDAARLTCPIGLPGIVGKEPEVIAAATAAQLLALRGNVP
ncbi:xanthine dehydrogenase accessory protein XdhC [uncultured Sphingomonas sp.]|uniref:xanthine dehydrogenase accessory protein XdhC n=1 Tax=uncultured Sphingomonas sp. TaxID=158754 RepID=UPI0035C9FEAC